jgi:peptidoglycan hydrolase CwlO-like protein
MVAKKTTNKKIKANKKKKITRREQLENISMRATRSLGSIESLGVHTVLFGICFASVLFGASLDRVLLVLTTVLSLEAIYLAIFIQMSVNQNTLQLLEVERDLEDLSEDIEEISEDIEGIEKDIEEIQEDIEEISEDVEEIHEDFDAQQGKLDLEKKNKK